MSIPVGINRTATFNGQPFKTSYSAEKERGGLFSQTLAAARSATLSARGSSTAGSLTFTGSNPFANSDVFDLYWKVDGVSYARFGCTVGTIASLVAPFTGGSGDDLPTLNSTVVAMKPITYTLDFDGILGDATLSFLAVQLANVGRVGFYEGSYYKYFRFTSSGQNFVWDPGLPGNETSPFADDDITPTNIVVSHGNTSAVKLDIAVGGDV